MNVAVGRLELSIRVNQPARELPAKPVRSEEVIPSEADFARDRLHQQVESDRSRWLDSAFMRSGWKL